MGLNWHKPEIHTIDDVRRVDTIAETTKNRTRDNILGYIFIENI